MYTVFGLAVLIFKISLIFKRGKTENGRHLRDAIFNSKLMDAFYLHVTLMYVANKIIMFHLIFFMTMPLKRFRDDKNRIF